MMHSQTKGLKHTDGSKLIRWLGDEQTESVSRAMRGFYYPVAVSGVPGNVWAMPGGDFVGDCRSGYEMSARDRLEAVVNRMRRGYRRSVQRGRLPTGFASLSDLIYEVTTNAKRQELAFNKNGAAGVTAATSSLFRLGAHPAAGSAASAAPGGSVPTVATTGALIFTNTGNSDTLHITTGQAIASVVSNTLMLYDRLFAVAKTASSTAAEAVTGVPTRYTSSNAAQADYAGGNFAFPEIGSSALGATNHNWTVCKYTPQDGGSPDSIFPSSVGVNTGAAYRLDLPLGTWFLPLQAGDIGVKSLTQMQNSASVTGALDFVIGHPLAWLPCPIANMACTLDGINSAFGLVRVYDNACLSLLEVIKPSGTATNYAGSVTLAQG